MDETHLEERLTLQSPGQRLSQICVPNLILYNCIVVPTVSSHFIGSVHSNYSGHVAYSSRSDFWTLPTCPRKCPTSCVGGVWAIRQMFVVISCTFHRLNLRVLVKAGWQGPSHGYLRHSTKDAQCKQEILPLAPPAYVVGIVTHSPSSAACQLPKFKPRRICSLLTRSSSIPWHSPSTSAACIKNSLCERCEILYSRISRKKRTCKNSTTDQAILLPLNLES